MVEVTCGVFEHFYQLACPYYKGGAKVPQFGALFSTPQRAEIVKLRPSQLHYEQIVFQLHSPMAGFSSAHALSHTSHGLI